MIGYATFVYPVAGLAFVAFAGSAWRAGLKWNAIFYGLVALSLLAGDWLTDIGNGLLALGLAAIAGLGRMKREAVEAAADRMVQAARRGNWLFAVALVIPVVALAGTFGFKALPGLVDPKQATLVALTLGVLLALVIGQLWLRPHPAEPFVAGRRLMDGVGWAAVLPQMLASLGAVFAVAGVGQVVGDLAGQAIPAGSLIGAVLAYALGMALFTIVMGNAFAAFPVMAAAIGIPILIHQFHGNPAVVAAIGMLAGFCGTLMTPMAANFNIVPAALLDLKDQNGVIKAQIPTALPLLAVNIILIWWLAF